MSETRKIAIAHHSADLYGSDLQMLESVSALIGDGWSVDLYVPEPGPLVARARDRGATVHVAPFPSVKRSILGLRGFTRFAGQFLRGSVRVTRLLRRTRPELIYVNTVVLPVWLVAALLSGRRRRTICHVHEAEPSMRRTARVLMLAPLFLASRIIANSLTTEQFLTSTFPALRHRTTVVVNGVPGPPGIPQEADWSGENSPINVLVVGRLSPRKGTDLALEAVAELRSAAARVDLWVCGTAYEEYEWFEDRLRLRAGQPDLAGRVTFMGYVENIWPMLAACHVVLMPTKGESFGNVAVEALHARRALVASRVHGINEIVRDGETGLLVNPDDPVEMAEAVARLARDPELARGLADAGWRAAADRFSVTSYREALSREVAGCLRTVESRSIRSS